MVGTKAVFDTALSPLAILVGKNPYSETIAESQIQTAYSRIGEWNKIKCGGNIDEVLSFIRDNKKLEIDWVSFRDVVPQTQKRLLQIQNQYSIFISQAQTAIAFERIYSAAINVNRDSDIASLVTFVHNNKCYDAALNEPSIKSKHEQVMFNLSRTSDSINGYDEFLAWYPYGAYADQARMLRNRQKQIEAERQRLEIERQAEAARVQADKHEETSLVTQTSPAQQEPLPKIASGGPVAARFRNVLDSHQKLLLLAAHPTGVINESNVTIQQAGNHNATLVDDISWHGPSGKHFRTIFTFTLTYNVQNTIDNVDMRVEETNNPFPPAFLAVSIAKQAILHYASDKVESRTAKVLIKVFNAETSIEGGLREALKVMANSQL
jgi:hypothetical protein